MCVRKRASLAFFLAGLLAFLGASGQARADSDPALSAAKAAFSKGQQLYLQKKFIQAAEAFLQANRAKPIPAFLFNAAVAFEKGKAYQKAVLYFRRYLAKKPKATDAGKIRRRIAVLEKALRDAAGPTPPRRTVEPPRRTVEPPRRTVEPPRRTVEPPRRTVEPPRRAVVRRRAVVLPALPTIRPKGVVVISTRPAGAAIYLNSKMKKLGQSPWQGSLPKGEYTVIIEHRGFKPEKKGISVSPDRLLDLFVALSREHYLGWVQITATTPGAKVYIDKREFGAIGRTPYTGFLKPGKHTIWVGKVGYHMAKKELNVVSGKTNRLHIRLTRLKHGWLTVSGATGYGAQVLLDGKELCKVPCDRVVVMPGKHSLEIRRKGYKPVKSDLIVRRLRLHTARIKLAKKPSRVSAYVAYGFAAGLLAGGIALGYISRQITDDLQGDINNNVLVNSSDGRFKRGRVYAYIANGMFGLAGLAAIFGVYYTFADRGPKSQVRLYHKRVAITPELGPTFAGVRGTWRW